MPTIPFPLGSARPLDELTDPELTIRTRQLRRHQTRAADAYDYAGSGRAAAELAAIGAEIARRESLTEPDHVETGPRRVGQPTHVWTSGPSRGYVRHANLNPGPDGAVVVVMWCERTRTTDGVMLGVFPTEIDALQGFGHAWPLDEPATAAA